MNSHVIPSTTITKLKKLNLEIEALREERSRHWYLKPMQQLNLTNKENKLTKILKQL